MHSEAMVFMEVVICVASGDFTKALVLNTQHINFWLYTFTSYKVIKDCLESLSPDYERSYVINP